MNTDRNNDKEKLYKNIETEGITENVAGEQTIQTEETKILKDKNGKKGIEVLIGKDINEVNEVEESHESLQRRILNKMMK